ncbi:uncharacterized protein J4E87_009661 [Alternaria ethzedia]|uniref:uncharacterized protein n=1 Tax=Alternaria ethzedia TaxID=181014 RepID=UPI0020C1F175|nr:uncharacterized protein J4E87_009661 [Alternaria ethzedia]KAI4614263.1 hypothetical protein J4E87_009661 [Alternaria ethzedia]
MAHVSTSVLETTTAPTQEHLRARLHEAVAIDKVAEKVDEELSTYIAIYAKAECMTLSKMVQSKLPRELRDIVYTHLVPRGTYIVWHPAHKREWIRFLRKSSCDHLFMEGYLSFDIMKEIVELWYERSNFVVLGYSYGSGNDPKRASRALDFFDDDSWSLDIDVRQHVRHIYIRLEYDGDVHVNVTQLAANLRRLTSLGENARVILQLQCMHFFYATLAGQQLIELVTELQVVFPVLEELVKGGKKVMVNVKGHDLFEVKVEKLNASDWISQLSEVLSDKDLLDIQS